MEIFVTFNSILNVSQGGNSLLVHPGTALPMQITNLKCDYDTVFVGQTVGQKSPPHSRLLTNSFIIFQLILSGGLV